MKTSTYFERWLICCMTLLLLVSIFGCDPVENPTTPDDSDKKDTYTVPISSSYFSKFGAEYNWFEGDVSSAEAYVYAASSNGNPFNAARWQAPFTKAGVYTVQAFIPAESQMAANARYDVIANGQTKNVYISQTTNPNKWVSLGSYTFSGQGVEYVELTNVTGGTNTRVVFSALKFTRETADAKLLPSLAHP